MKRENCVLIDWLSFTTTIHTPEQIMQFIGLPELELWQQLNGVRGYGGRYYRDSISIHFGGRDEVWLEMTGQGCRSFESYGTGDYNSIFNEIVASPNEINLTRLDVAFDEYTEITDINRMCADVRDKKWKSVSSFWEVIESSKGKSCQVGSPQSLVLVRIYDKLAERLANTKLESDREKIRAEISHWNRIELQLRDERAREFVKYLLYDNPVKDMGEALTLGEAYAGVLQRYINFGYATTARGHPEQEVWHTFPYWQKVLGAAREISVYRSPGVDYNFARCMNYVQNMAGNAIDAMIKIKGMDEFCNIIRQRQIKQNPKYKDMMQRQGVLPDPYGRDNRRTLVTEQELRTYLEENTDKPFVVDGIRYCLCMECKQILAVEEFAMHGGAGRQTLGTCLKCFW